MILSQWGFDFCFTLVGFWSTDDPRQDSAVSVLIWQQYVITSQEYFPSFKRGLNVAVQGFKFHEGVASRCGKWRGVCRVVWQIRFGSGRELKVGISWNESALAICAADWHSRTIWLEQCTKASIEIDGGKAKVAVAFVWQHYCVFQVVLAGSFDLIETGWCQWINWPVGSVKSGKNKWGSVSRLS